MNNINLAKNPMRDRQDLEDMFLLMLEPYLKDMSKSHALLNPHTGGATFSAKAAELEGFSRLLWGIVPFIKGIGNREEADKLTSIVTEGISAGVNPRHPEYWGRSADYDQRLVEMAAFAYALLMIPEKIWEPLGAKDRDNLTDWLLDINRRKIPECNWMFFRILVNCALIKLGRIDSSDLLTAALDQVDVFYIGDIAASGHGGPGWYNDGDPDKRRARDYYIPWAMQFYGLVFSAYCSDIFPEKAALYRERALAFAPEFRCWFDGNGQGLPFGRSLTYRFAQCAFWGALPLAFDEGPDWQDAASIFKAHMKWWCGQPVFDGSGRLSIGYRYPNQYMAERYNSENSPLWAFKAFAPLAVGRDHPFWQAGDGGETRETKKVQSGSGLCFFTEKTAGHHYALNAGQWTPGISNEHLHMAEKYGKFAYSSYFGFNVVTDAYGLDKLAADNMLLLSDEDQEGYYRYRKESSSWKICDDFLYSVWKPFGDVTVETWLVPISGGEWHVRIHQIDTGRVLYSAEGGFPLAFGDDYYPVPDAEDTRTEITAAAKSSFGTSVITDLNEKVKKRDGFIVPSSPNANIMYPRTVVPVLKGLHGKGKSVLVSAVFAHPDPKRQSAVPETDEYAEKLPENIRQLIME